MPSDYTSSPSATQAPSPTPAQDALPIARLPVDGEAANVASITQIVKMLADGLGWSWANAVHKAAARTITAILTFAEKAILNGQSGDTNPAVETTSPPAARKLLWKISLGGVVYLRWYSSLTESGSEWVVNAHWDGTNWQFDGAGAAIRLRLFAFGTNGFSLQYNSSGAAFAEGAWVNALTLANSDSSLAAKGDVKAKRYRSSGTALVAGDFTLGAGWGDTATVAVISGDDTAGTCTVTAGGVGMAQNPTLTLTFKDGTYTAAPSVIVTLANASSDAATRNIKWVVTATDFTVTWLGGPGNGDTFIFRWQVTGH